MLLTGFHHSVGLWGKPSATLKEKTEASILRQAGLRKEQS
jgi:hypothetical protein